MVHYVSRKKWGHVTRHVSLFFLSVMRKYEGVKNGDMYSATCPCFLKGGFPKKSGHVTRYVSLFFSR